MLLLLLLLPMLMFLHADCIGLVVYNVGSLHGFMLLFPILLSIKQSQMYINKCSLPIALFRLVDCTNFFSYYFFFFSCVFHSSIRSLLFLRVLAFCVCVVFVVVYVLLLLIFAQPHFLLL